MATRRTATYQRQSGSSRRRRRLRRHTRANVTKPVQLISESTPTPTSLTVLETHRPRCHSRTTPNNPAQTSRSMSTSTMKTSRRKEHDYGQPIPIPIPIPIPNPNTNQGLVLISTSFPRRENGQDRRISISRPVYVDSSTRYGLTSQL